MGFSNVEITSYIAKLCLPREKALWKSIGHICQRKPCLRRRKTCSRCLRCTNPSHIHMNSSNSCYLIFRFVSPVLHFHQLLKSKFWFLCSLQNFSRLLIRTSRKGFSPITIILCCKINKRNGG